MFNNNLFFRNAENPVLCNESLTDLVTIMEEQHARILGVAHCIVPQEIALENPMILPPLPLLPKIVQKPVSIVPNSIMQPPPSIVQVIVPSPVVLPVAVAQPLISATSTVASTTVATTTTPRPPEETTTESLIMSILSTATEVPAEVQKVTEEVTTTTVRSLGVVSELPSTPQPQVIVQGFHEMTHQLIPEPEEPPETLQDEGTPPERLQGN